MDYLDNFLSVCNAEHCQSSLIAMRIEFSADTLLKIGPRTVFYLPLGAKNMLRAATVFHTARCTA